jgi:hypothetical protein
MKGNTMSSIMSITSNTLTFDDWDLTTLSDDSSGVEIRYNFTADPLLVSCTLHRLIKESRANDKYTYCNWSLVEHMDQIITHITDRDRIFAETVKSYYLSKLLMAKLRNENLTKYKSDLLTCLNESSLTITNKFVGMIYKLPCFYEYDMKVIEIFGGEYNDISGKNYSGRTDVTLSYISKADNGQKRSRFYEYWFKDSDDVRILLEVEKHNPILDLWDQHVNLGNDISINATFEKKRRDNLEFFVARGWHISV